MDLLVDLLAKLGSAFLSLGPAGMFKVTLGVVIVWVGIKFFDRAERTLERVERRWKRWSTPTRWSVALLAAVFVGPTVWALLPKSDGALAVGLGLYAAWWYQGVRYVERYSLTDATAYSAWKHHVSATRAARRHTAAINDASTKKGGTASKPVPHATGETYVAHPGFGESATEFAERINLGELVSAEKARTGKDVHGMSGTPLPDGSVEVVVEYAAGASTDPLAESKWWKP